MTHPHPDPQTRPTVLVVDDEPELRALLAEYFGRNRFAVVKAENAAVARERVSERVPDVAVLDINMPDESGLSLARALRESHGRPVRHSEATGSRSAHAGSTSRSASSATP